jgi:transposase
VREGRKCSQSRLWTHANERRRHRSWPEALKREIVAASFAPGSSVSVVAQQYDVNANQVFSWRKRYRDALPAPSDSSTSQLMPVVITTGADDVAAPASTVAEKIEIDVADKYRVSVGSGFDRRLPACARRVGKAMIPVPSGVRVWLAVGRTDMRRSVNGLALQV